MRRISSVSPVMHLILTSKHARQPEHCQEGGSSPHCLLLSLAALPTKQRHFHVAEEGACKARPRHLLEGTQAVKTRTGKEAQICVAHSPHSCFYTMLPPPSWGGSNRNITTGNTPGYILRCPQISKLLKRNLGEESHCKVTQLACTRNLCRQAQL